MRQTLMLLAIAAICTLPATWTPVQAQNVEIRNFSGSVHPLRKIVRLHWWASEDSLVTLFTIEHSLDGQTFTPIGDVTPLLTGEDGHIYEFWHVDQILGLNYYRLVIHFAHTADPRILDPIKIDVGAPPIYSYPTIPRPGTGLVTPLTGNPDDILLEARVTDLYGRPVAAVKGQTELNLPDLPAGLYVLHARYESGWYATQFVVTPDE